MELDPPLNARRISAALAGQEIGRSIQVHEELGSTNDLARELGEAAHEHGTVVLAEHQTSGRGRRENAWNAQARKNVLLSILLRPVWRMELWPRITTLAALALCRAIEGHSGLKATIKWPNDIYLGNLKCVGILAETFSGVGGAFLVLGMGINVNETSFPKDLEKIATSLKQARGGDSNVDRDAVVISLLRQMNLLIRQWDDGFSQVVDEVRRQSWLLGRRITARMNERWLEGVAVDLDLEGHLLMREDSGTVITLTSAEQVRACP